jgi:hypothetical protein
MGGLRRFVLLSLALGAVGLVGLAVPAAAQQTTPVTTPAYPPNAPVIDPCVANPNACQVASPGATGQVASPGAAGKLAFTGSSSTFPFAEAGIGLVLVGGVLAVAMRRRRSAHTLKI